MVHIDEKTRRVIDACGKCHDVCLETSTRVLEHGGKPADPAHVRLLRETAEICRTGAYFLIVGSDFVDEVCDLVARISMRCAQACEKIDDPLLRECATACRKCADSCLSIAEIPRAA